MAQVRELEAQLAQAAQLIARLQQENEALALQLQQAAPAPAAAARPLLMPAHSPAGDARNSDEAAAVLEGVLQQVNEPAEAAAPEHAATLGHAAAKEAATAAAASRQADVAETPGVAAVSSADVAVLPYEGLSQALSQGSLAWLDGVIGPPGSCPEAAGAAAGRIPEADDPAQEQAVNASPAGQAQLSAAACAAEASQQDAPPQQQHQGFMEHVPPHSAAQVFELPLTQPSAAEQGSAAEEPTAAVGAAVTCTAIEPAEEHGVQGGVPAAVSADKAGAEQEDAAEMGAQEAAPKEADEDPEEEAEVEEEEQCCGVCGEADEGDVLLLCDGCDAACHLGCARPRLRHA